MPTISLYLDPDELVVSKESVQFLPGVVFNKSSTITDVQAKISGTGEAKIRLSEPDANYYFAPNTESTTDSNEEDTEYTQPTPTHLWTSQYPGLTDKISTGYFTNWRRWDDNTEGTTQTTSGYRPQWIDNRQNGFPAVRTVVLDHVIWDTDFSVRSNQEWSIVIKMGPYTPSLYGCCLGSRNTTGTAIKTAYHWAGVYAKLRHDSGGEFQVNANTGTQGKYFGGPNSVHVLRCDGNNNVKIRVNGQYETSSSVTANSQYNFERIAHYKTTSTQRYANVEFMEIIGYDNHYLTDLEVKAIEGSLCAKYDTRDILPSTHPWSDSSSLLDEDAYDTVKTDSDKGVTSALLNSLSTSLSSLSIVSGKSTYAAGEGLVLYLDDYDHNCGTITVQVTYTEN